MDMRTIIGMNTSRTAADSAIKSDIDDKVANGSSALNTMETKTMIDVASEDQAVLDANGFVANKTIMDVHCGEIFPNITASKSQSLGDVNKRSSVAETVLVSHVVSSRVEYMAENSDGFVVVSSLVQHFRFKMYFFGSFEILQRSDEIGYASHFVVCNVEYSSECAPRLVF